MKFTFITAAAVVVLWSARVDGDHANIYAGIPDDTPFSKQDDDYSPLFPESSSYLVPKMRGSFPWTRERKPTKAAPPTLFRQLEEVLERRREQMKVDAVKNFQYLSPHQSILDDPRPYALDDQDGDQELDDGDFTFPGDDVILDNNDAGGLTQAEQIYLSRQPYSRLNPWEGYDNSNENIPVSHEQHSTHRMHENEGAILNPAGSGLFKDVEFVKDPADFAYPPTDPRYFEDKTRHETIEETLSKMVKVNVKTLNKLNKPNYGDSAASATYTNTDPEITADIRANADDYGFLTDDDDQTRQQLLHDMDVNDKLSNEKEYLKNNGDVDVVAVRTQNNDDSTGIYILAIIAGVSAAALVTLITLVITWFNLQKHVKNASDAEYPAYGVTGPNKEVSPSGDRRLAQSAQMYHYQHQKQQIIAMERAAATERHGSISEADSDEENEEGDYTVYECPGLAPTGEMEVKNPMFQDDPTPAQTPQQKQSDGSGAKK